MKVLAENIRLAFTSLTANKSRALLTMLGIIIGIASVIGIMTVGNSLSLSISSSMQSMGANNITVSLSQRENEAEERENGIVFGTNKNSREPTEDDYFTDEMIYALREQFPDSIEAISASETVGEGIVQKGSKSIKLNVSGVSLGYFKANEFTVVEGSMISQKEFIGAKNVVFVSDKFCEDFFEDQSNNVLGKDFKIEIGNQTVSYTVIGIYEYEESSISSGTTECYIPLTTAQNFNHTKITPHSVWFQG